MIQRVDVAIDCRDLVQMSKFWTSLLDYAQSEPLDDRYWAAEHPSGAGPRLVFQAVDDVPLPNKAPFHMDVHVQDVEAVVGKLIALGGSRVDLEPISEAGSMWVRCLDPEGNVLCIVQARR